MNQNGTPAPPVYPTADPNPPQPQQQLPQQQPPTQQQFLVQQQPPANLTIRQQQQLYQLQQVQQQQPPQEIQWMPLPQGIPQCPPGLEYLTQLDQLLVHQQVELIELVTNLETENRYQIKNTLGQQCYYANEESDLFDRNCCGKYRGFVMHLTDNSGREVIRVHREFKCCSGCTWCATGGHCSQTVEVESPPGSLVGRVVQSQTSWAPRYAVLDAAGQHIFTIKGPNCVCNSPYYANDITFEICAGSGDGGESPVGRLTKQFGGLARELLTKATNFSLTFPLDLDVKMKAVLLGGTFLIDFLFFEEPRNNRNR